jgi:hypothetical protein
MKQPAPKEWSDTKKWWMELFKTFVTFTAGALVSLLVIERIQHSRAVVKAKEDAFYKVRVRSLADFRESAVTYDRAGYSAFTDLELGAICSVIAKKIASTLFPPTSVHTMKPTVSPR